MQITCLKFDVSVDDSGCTAVSADLMLDDTGVVIKGVRMADHPDGSTTVDLPDGSVSFASPFYERAFVALAIQSVAKVKIENDTAAAVRVKAIADATSANTQLSRLVN